MAFDPPELRFGNVCVGETAETSLRVTNRGALMQQFGFVGLPEDVDVAPARFGEILPGETRDVRVRFAPKRVGRREFKVTVKSLLGAREFAVPCRGGVFPPLETPGGNVLTLPPTAIRESVAGSVFLRNPSDDATETFEIIAPRDARDALVVSPHVGTLGPGETKRVRVAFCPKTHETRRDGDAKSDEAGGGDGVGSRRGRSRPPADGAAASDGFVRSDASPRGHVAIDGARRASLANRRFERGSLVRARRRASSHATRFAPRRTGPRFPWKIYPRRPDRRRWRTRWISATWRSARARRVP